MSGVLGAHHHSTQQARPAGASVPAESAATAATSATSSDPNIPRPDIFSLVAQESLLEALNPAFCHVIKVLATKYPAQTGFLHQYREEVYACLSALLQGYTLHTYSASFSEHFYGLKRNPVEPGGWSRLRRTINLLVLVILPYLSRKLQALYEQYTDDSSDSADADRDAVHRVLLLRVYPYAHSVWSSVKLIYLLRYMYGSSDAHSPLISACQVRLHYAEPQPADPSAPLHQAFCALLSSSGTRGERLRKCLALAAHSVASTLFPLFSASVFFLQFLQWYSSSNSESSSYSSDGLSSPASVPPPKINEQLASQAGICPICNRTLTNSTALSTSGVVCCYPCIYSFIRQHSICPVSRRPASLDNLIKLHAQ